MISYSKGLSDQWVGFSRTTSIKVGKPGYALSENHIRQQLLLDSTPTN